VLVDDLKAHRLQITKAHLAGGFGVAFDLALYALGIELFRQIGYFVNPLELRANETNPNSALNDLAGTPADRLLKARKAALDLDWLELPEAQAFAALSALPVEDKQRLFAWCIASCLKPQLAIEDRADPAIEATGRRLAIPFADYWRPTAANYWGRVKKAHGLAVSREILGGRGTTPATRSRRSLPRSKPRSTARPAPAASASVRRSAIAPPIGCHPAWLMPRLRLPAKPRNPRAEMPAKTRIPSSARPLSSTAMRTTATARRSSARRTSCRPSSPKTSTTAPHSMGLRRPDAHFRNGDRAAAGAVSTSAHPRQRL
jgi:hypothetical protein